MKVFIYSFVLLALFAVTYAVTCPEEDGDEDLYYANPDNCNTYFVCNHGEGVEMNCAAALYFNSETNRCDWPENVECTVSETGDAEEESEDAEKEDEDEQKEDSE